MHHNTQNPLEREQLRTTGNTHGQTPATGECEIELKSRQISEDAHRTITT
jgi:hypothetical protein